MAIALDQDLGFSGTTNNTVAVSGTFPAGALICVVVGFGTANGGGSAISQSGSAFTTLFTRENSSTNNLVYYTGYIANWGGGSLSTTFTLNGVGKDAGARLLSFTGVDTSAPLLLSNDHGSNPKSTTMDSNAATGTTNSTDLLVGFFTWANSSDITGDSAGGTPSTGWTKTAHSNGSSGNTPHGHALFTYQILTSAVTNPDAQVTFTSPSAGVSYGASIATFKAAAGGGTVNGSATLNSASSLVVQGDGESAVLESASDLFPYIMTGTSTLLALGSDSAVLDSAANLLAVGGASDVLNSDSLIVALGSDNATLTADSSLLGLGSASAAINSAPSLVSLGSDSAILASHSDVLLLTASGMVLLGSGSALQSLGSSAGLVLKAQSLLSVDASPTIFASATLLSGSSLLALGSDNLDLAGASSLSVTGQVLAFGSSTLLSDSSLITLGGASVLVGSESLLQVTAQATSPNQSPLVAVSKVIAQVSAKDSLASLLTSKSLAASALIVKNLAAGAISRTSSLSPYIQVASSRRPSVPTPNTTITSTQTCTYTSNGAAMTTGNPVTCVVTFPDGTTGNYALGTGIVNAGAGAYTLTYTTKGPGTHKELWSFTDTSTGYVLQTEVLTPVTY